MRMCKRYFSLPDTVNWFPGHMLKATKLMKEKLKHADVFLEVRDARLPFSSSNSLLERELFKDKPRVIVFNKSDLLDERLIKKIKKKCVDNNQTRHSFTCCSQRNKKFPIKDVITAGIDIAVKNYGKNHITMMVCGFPNIGKSSLINQVRGEFGVKGRTKVSAKAGLTRQIESFKVNNNPAAYLIDSPGIMLPQRETAGIGLKLSVIGSVPETVIGYERIADYLLTFLYKDEEGIEVLKKLVSPLEIPYYAEEYLPILGKRMKGTEDIDFAAKFILKKFRKGELGKYILDEI